MWRYMISSQISSHRCHSYSCAVNYCSAALAAEISKPGLDSAITNSQTFIVARWRAEASDGREMGRSAVSQPGPVHARLQCRLQRAVFAL